MDVHVDFENYHRDGYLIFRNVFDKERIADYRQKLDESWVLPTDLGGQHVFCELLFDPIIVQIATKLLGTAPTYFGFSSMSKGTTAGTASWHRDCADRLDPTGPDWQGGPYTVIRFGIYMQDHKNFSGGLMVRPGSHLVEQYRTKSIAYLDTQPGDLAVWNKRIVHAGDGVRRKDDPLRPIDLPEAKATPPEEFLPSPPGLRYVAFITYGVSGDVHTEHFIDYLATRHFMVNLWQKVKLCDRGRTLLPSSGVIYRDIWSEIKDRPGIGRHVNHVEKAHLNEETAWAEQVASH